MRVFISHWSEERALAAALSDLLGSVRGVESWYSSSETSGMGIGDWRKQIEKELQACDAIIAIVTPQARNNQWLNWECGFATGFERGRATGKPRSESGPIPVIFYVESDELPRTLTERQWFDGTSAAGLNSLLRGLQELQGEASAASPALSSEPLAEYFEAISPLLPRLRQLAMFEGEFHNLKAAKGLRGTWYSLWTAVDESGEKILTRNVLEAWTTGERIRWLGQGRKDADGERIPYPMEGILSGGRKMPLTWWSPGEADWCGTAMLQVDREGQYMEGSWQGLSFLERKKRTRWQTMEGRVFIERREEDLPRDEGDLPT